MDLQPFIIETATFTIAGCITLLLGYSLIKNDLNKYLRIKAHSLKKDDKTQLLNLRLQAHERMIVFIERINPSNLFVRVHQQGVALRELQAVLLNEIRTEYQHNITQQLYLNKDTWNVIKKLKEDTLGMINSAVKHLPEDVAGLELSKSVLQHMAELGDNPYDLTIDLIKKDIHQMF